MGAVRIVLHSAAVRSLLRSDEVLADLKRRGEAIAKAADGAVSEDGAHEVDALLGKNRARVEIRTETAKAKVAEATHRTLTSSIDAGRQ